MNKAADDARIAAALNASFKAQQAGDLVSADRHWREFIGLLEVQMGRTGSAERLTPAITRETIFP